MQNAVAVQDEQLPSTQLMPNLENNLAEMKRRRELVTTVLKEVMKKGVHYGEIPGTESYALLKPGAEMLGSFFQLQTSFRAHARELDRGHREYVVDCTLMHGGAIIAEASGLCSTMESKYRWRNAKPRCPDCGYEGVRRSEREFYCWKKKGGCGATFALNDTRIRGQQLGKVENADIADVMNTVMKMAAKRAHVAAIRLALACSDMFEHEEAAEEREREGSDDGDYGEPPPPREPRRSEKAPPKLTPKQEIAQECSVLATKLGLDLEGVRGVLEDGGAYSQFKRWSDLTEGELKKCREVLAAEVEMRAEK